MVIGAVLGSFVIPLWGQRAPEIERLKQKIVVGTAIDSYPKSFLGGSGRCEGFAVDLLDAVARAMDLKIERIRGSSADLRRRFENGDFDALEIYSPGPGRDQIADFSEPYLLLHSAIFIRRDDSRVHSLNDLNGADLLLSARNSVADRFLEDYHLKPKSIQYVSSTEEGVRLLNSGSFDAVFASRLGALSIIERDHLTQVRALDDPLVGYDFPQCFAVHKGDTELLSRLNEGLAVVHRSGEFDRIYRRWFGQLDSSAFTREQAIAYAAPVLAAALGAAIFVLLHQRRLQRRLVRQAERLAESEAHLAEAQRIAQVGHWRFDGTTRVITASPEMLRILERDPASPAPSYRRLLGMTPPAERVIAHRTVREALQTGVSGEVTLAIYPRREARKIVHVKFQAVRNSGDLVTGLVGTAQDITQQKIIEEDLRSRGQLLRAIYENVPSALGVVEADGTSFKIVSANPGAARLFGLDPRASIAGRSLTELGLPDRVLDFWIHWFQRGVEYGEIMKAEPETGDGRRHLSLVFIPLGFSPSGYPHLCFLAEDITERKQIDAEIAQGRRLRAVGELVGGIAHEFNNLLTPIVLKSELLSSEYRNEPRLLEELRAISRAAERGSDLTKRLLAFGRRSETEPKEVKLNAAVRSVIDLLTPTIDRRVQLLNEVPDTLPTLFVNPSELHQIMLNLVLNARDTLVDKLNRQPSDNWRAVVRLHATRYGPTAIENTHWARPGAPAGWICLSVSDNGLGMAQPVLDRIFEPFYTTKGFGKGVGLGLATVWHLVTRLGGKITVQSRVGEGSTFHVWLPTFPPKKTVDSVATRAPFSAQINARICLVEDDELVAQTVSMALRRQGHQVVRFSHGVEAWSHLGAHHADYDMLLLDLDLPGISGLELARRARTARFPGKILVASGRLSHHDSRELEKLGVDFQIEKPFTPTKLHLAVQTCLAQRNPGDGAKATT